MAQCASGANRRRLGRDHEGDHRQDVRPLMKGAVLFAGCKPEVAAGPDGRIIGLGARAREAAGRGAEVIRLRGTAWPGLIDAHVHLEGLAERHLTLDLASARSLEDALGRVKQWAARLPKDGWVVG